MDALKYRHLATKMTAIGALFSVARGVKCTEKRLAHVRK